MYVSSWRWLLYVPVKLPVKVEWKMGSIWSHFNQMVAMPASMKFLMALVHKHHKDINLSVNIPVLVGHILGLNQIYKLGFYWTQRSLLPCTLRFLSTPRWCFNSWVLHEQIIYEKVNVPDDWLPGVALRWVHTTWEKIVTATGQDCWSMMQSKIVKFCL